MGATSSTTRKLTVENDDPTSVIKVSEDVVDRLKGSQVPRNRETVPAPTSQNVGHVPLFLHEPAVTSNQVRQTNLAELKKNDDYWRQRLSNLEENHKRMNQIMDEEYKKAIEEFSTKTKVTGQQKLPLCKTTEKAVMECYKMYPNEPMRCAKVVQAFQECVDSKRNTLLANRG